MTLLRFILLPILFLSARSSGQQSFNVDKLVGKTFVSKTLEYLEIINDSTLYSSINSYNDTASFIIKKDTLLIKQKYRQTDKTGSKDVIKFYDYNIVSITHD